MFDSLIPQNQNILQFKSNVEMLAFLALKVVQPIYNKQKYKEALQEIKHYLSFKQIAQLEETDFVISVRKGQYNLQLVKHPNYLHNNYYNIPVVNQEDLQFLDICYECLMIVRQTFPSKIKIEIVSDEDSKQLISLHERKEDQFNRRVNSNLKTLAEQKTLFDCQDIEDLIYLTINHYSRKNKNLAIKLLMVRISQQNLGNFTEQFIDSLKSMTQEGELKKLVYELVNKMKSMQITQSKNKENLIQQSNINHEQVQPLKLNPLIFQLKQSYNLKRICSLIAIVIAQEKDKQFLTKIEPSIVLVTNRFLTNQYDQMIEYCNEFLNVIRGYWNKRAKKWDQSIRLSLQERVRQLTDNHRTSSNRKKVIQRVLNQQ